jgi:2-keto-4-pentenoate hydratase/2-oxohepta-3-ene-1,7-dioic acid hydratase in catechol pathway
MPNFQLVSYQAADGVRAGAVVEGRVFDLARLTGHAADDTIRDLLADWQRGHDRITTALTRGTQSASIALADAKLYAPVLYPSAIYCAGANYQDHADEMSAKQGRPPEPDPHTLGLKPWHFIKASTAVTHPGATVTLPRASKSVDWEAELAAVIGRTAKDVPTARALDYVAGYLCANDLSARDLGTREAIPAANPFRNDWTAHKSFDGSCPLGPWIVPAYQVGDPQKLGIKLWVNDVLKQDSNTSKMIFSLAEQIEQLSSRITLHPGDIVLTGTPAGVGAGRGEFLKPGDVVKIWIEKVGTLTNTMA